MCFSPFLFFFFFSFFTNANKTQAGISRTLENSVEQVKRNTAPIMYSDP